MHLKKPLILLSIILLASLQAVASPVQAGSQAIIKLHEFQNTRSIDDTQQYYFYDPGDEVHVAELFSGLHNHRFHKVDFADPESDIRDIEPDHVVWIRYIIHNNGSKPSGIFHLQPYEDLTFKEFVLYQRLDNGEIILERSGRDVRPPWKKPVNISGSDDLPFHVAKQVTDTLYLKVKTGKRSRMTELDFTISSLEKVTSNDKKKRLAFGIFTGIFLIMIMYHISLYARGQERSYLYYILYISSFLIFFIHKEGYFYELVQIPNIENLTLVLLEVAFLFFLLFGIAYLDLKNRLSNWDQILQMAVWFSILGLCTNLLITFLDGMGLNIPYIFYTFGEAILMLSAAGCLLLAIAPAVILTRDNYQPARYFLIANVFILLGFILPFILNFFQQRYSGNQELGLLKFLQDHGIELGVTLQILTFSIGLSERINMLKIGRELAQRKIIDQLRENANLKDKVNQELEDKVQERTFEIQTQKEHIEKQNKEIKYSFDYAKKIQNTVLPTNEIFENLFGEHFIFFKPRDIVSGDFYWITQSQTKIVLTAADCTGHGVPGSLMSMLGITMLHEIVNEKNIKHSDEILNQLRLSIARTLKQEGRIGEQKDGIDMALMIYDTKTQKLEYSGANSPLYIIRNGEMLEYKGNNMPVAFYERMSDFTRYSIEMKQGDRVYMFTDGFPDQFGGPAGKKFKHRPFKELLLEVHDRPMDEQHRILSLIFEEWKGDLGQIDDVLVIGLRL